MNKALLGILAALAVVPASVAMACSSDGQQGIFPKNNAYIPVGNSATHSALKEEFDNANAKMLALYAPVFEAQGRELKIIADWEDGTVNAYADRKGNVSEVHMFGGLARHTKVTADGYMLVICHETGHHIGGAPKKGASWATNEGGSDYWATLKCAREVWKDEDNAAKVASMEIPQSVTQQCQKAFDSSFDIAICQRAAMGGKSLADTLGALGRTGDTDFDKPDPAVVSRTNNNHPAAQCRLDTYFAGAVCNKTKDSAPSDSDPRVGSCASENGETLGVRPACWYATMDTSPTPDGGDGDSDSGSSWPSMRIKRRVSTR